MLYIKCADLGINCNYVAVAQSKAELIAQMESHAVRAHNMRTIQNDAMDKLKRAIQDQ